MAPRRETCPTRSSLRKASKKSEAEMTYAEKEHLWAAKEAANIAADDDRFDMSLAPSAKMLVDAHKQILPPYRFKNVIQKSKPPSPHRPKQPKTRPLASGGRISIKDYRNWESQEPSYIPLKAGVQDPWKPHRVRPPNPINKRLEKVLAIEVVAGACEKILDALGPFDISENSEISDELRSLCVVEWREVADKPATPGIAQNQAQVCLLGSLLVQSKVYNRISSSGRVRAASWFFASSFLCSMLTALDIYAVKFTLS